MKEHIENRLKIFLMTIFFIIAIPTFIYGMYWITKTGSYFFFYEYMVQETVREMVKPEYLTHPQ